MSSKKGNNVLYVINHNSLLQILKRNLLATEKIYAIILWKSMFGLRVHFNAKHQIGVTLTEKGHLTTLNRKT